METKTGRWKLTAALVGMLASAPGWAAGTFNDGDGGESAIAPTSTPAMATEFAGRLTWGGYGQFDYRRLDFFQNAQDTTPETRARTDLRRFVLEPRVQLAPSIHFVAEIEIEHGGVGSTVEYEPEEAGEFEAEIEQGGEVVLENAFLQFSHSSAINWRVGEMTVPIGMLNRYHRPTQHFTIDRSLAESALIPGTWHDFGIALVGEIGSSRYRMMLVRALDSTSFSGYRFVSDGSRRRLEYGEASDIALVLAAEHVVVPQAVIGASFYHGDSAGNRPRGGLDTSANVTLFEIHSRWERGPLTVRAEYLVGRLQNADKVTQANFNTFNSGELGVSRTPIGSRADAYFVEVGYDVLSLQGLRDDRLDVFARFDAYDTHADVTGTIARNQRYRRDAVTLGINYRPIADVVLKAEFSRRSNDGSTANEQDAFGLAVGFQF